MARRVLITGLSTFWGGRVAQQLEADPDVEVIICLDRHEPTVKLVDSRDAYMPIFPSEIDVVPEYGGGIVNFLNSQANGADAKRSIIVSSHTLSVHLFTSPTSRPASFNPMTASSARCRVSPKETT